MPVAVIFSFFFNLLCPTAIYGELSGRRELGDYFDNQHTLSLHPLSSGMVSTLSVSCTWLPPACRLFCNLQRSSNHIPAVQDKPYRET